MKKKLMLVLAAGMLSIGLSAQCYLPPGASMDATLDFLWEQYLESGDTSHIKSYQRTYERGKQAAAQPQAAAFFSQARAYMIEKLGEDLFCQRVDMNLWSAFKFYGKMHQIQFRFFFDNLSEQGEKGYQVYHFYYDTGKDTNRITYPQVLDCRNQPELCGFKVVSEEQALQIAERAGFLNGLRHNAPRRVHNQWGWEIEKLLNDDCKAQKMLIDMYTGEIHYSDYYTWYGCIPLNDKVTKSHIVIEGTPLDDDRGYSHQGQIWTSRLVEVNRLFKGAVKAGVVEVITMGGQVGNRFQSLSHGQISLPGKGRTAIFFLRSPWEIEPDAYTHGRSIDSLSPYPVYHVFWYEPLVLYSDHTAKTSFTRHIERNTYQAIEAAAGQKRKNLLLPALEGEAFKEWAIEHRLSVPTRHLGLEYLIAPQNPAAQNDSISFFIAINALSSHSYLSRSRVVLHYNPAVFGDSIVSKNKLAYQPMQRSSFNIKNYSFGKRLVPPGYQFSAKDLSDSTFQIEFRRPEDDTNFFQLTPFAEVFTSWEGLPLVEIKLPIQNESESMDIEFVEKEMADGHYHFDFEKGEEAPYAFAWAHGGIDFPARDFQKPELAEVSPDTLRYWTDTLTIRGKNLLGHGAEIMIWCKREGRNYHRPLPRNCIISHTSTEVKCRIPDQIITDDNPAGRSVSWYPVSGPVRVVKTVMGWRLSRESKESVFLK